MSKQHLQFVIEGKLLWSSKLIIRVSSLCQRYVKETLSSLARRYLAKLNTLPDTFCLLCSMETPLSDILAEDSSLDKPTQDFYITWHILSFHSKPVNSNSSAKVVSPFKPSRIARLRFQQSSFCQAQEYSWNYSCLIALLSPYKAEKFPITGWKAWKKGKIKTSRLCQQQISTTDW